MEATMIPRMIVTYAFSDRTEFSVTTPLNWQFLRQAMLPSHYGRLTVVWWVILLGRFQKNSMP